MSDYRVRAVRNGTDAGHVRLELTGEERCAYTLYRRHYVALGSPVVGDALGAEAMDAIQSYARYYRTRELALGILARGDNSRLGLLRKLKAKGCPEELSREICLSLLEAGYLREEDGAYRMAVLAGKKGWGMRKVHAYLISRGFSGSLARNAISRAVENGDVDFDKNRRAFIATRQKRGQTDTQIRAALWRAGF